METEAIVPIGIPTAVDDPDLSLVRLSQTGDHAAFQALYSKYLKRVHQLVFRMIGSSEQAEEVTQEAFYQIYRGLRNFGERSQFYTWLYRVVINVTLQHFKKQASH